jgi:putative flavoprotein involved in K+ transport
LAARLLLARFLLRVVFHRILTIRTPMGRKARPRMLSKGTPLIRVRTKDLVAAGIQRVPRVVGVRAGLPVLQDGRVLEVTNVIWCTGFHGGFSWIDLPVIDDRGEPIHDAGVVGSAPGLYFVGLHFLFSMSSSMIHGVGRDAARIARAVDAAARARTPAEAKAPASKR